MSLKLFMVAGEASADLHGAALLSELRTRIPDLECFGVGDRALAREGMEVLVNAGALNVVGITDWMDRVREVVGAYRDTTALLERRRPDAAVLIDLPDFNLLLARRLKRLGVPVFYYISPQVWAWRRYRVRTIRRVVDRMLVVFPFEKEFYDRHGVEAEFVGHPLLDSIEPRAAYRAPGEIAAAPRLAVLPGSRSSELRFHAPLLGETIARLRRELPKLEIRLPVAPTLASEAVRAAFPDPAVELVGDARAALAWADAALVASGTATLETALVGTPFALFYVVSPLSHFLGWDLIGYRGFLGMPNLLHGREVAREFLQKRATPEALAAETHRLLFDGAYREGVTRDIRACREKLGRPGASARAAAHIAERLHSRERVAGGFAIPQTT